MNAYWFVVGACSGIALAGYVRDRAETAYLAVMLMARRKR